MNQHVDFNNASDVLKTETEVPSAGRKMVKLHDTITSVKTSLQLTEITDYYFFTVNYSNY